MKFGKRRMTTLFLLGTGAAMFFGPALAGDSPWSRARDVSGPIRSNASTDSTKTVFDITVSLYANPQGDDKYPEDGGAADADQKKYEANFEYFADALCEQTNGAHHLGKVSIFRQGRQAGSSDIVWVENCHPSASPSGFGFSGKRINMCDNFSGVSFLSDPENGGNTIAHEWGHYGLGLFDEYRGSSNPADPVTYAYLPRTTDTPTSPSIMNSQWNAKGGNYEWLNHSTSNNIGDLTKTAQGRVFDKSGWDALVQPTTSDPRDPFSLFGTSRTRYTNLVGPTAADGWVKEELPAAQATCRADLDVIWVSENLETQLVIDTSGSMSGSPLNNAKVAANTLVDVVPGGSTALGLVEFNTDVSQETPIAAIPDPGTAERATVKAAVNALSATGVTSLYDGLTFALNGLSTYATANNTTAGQVVFVLSDGGDNDSTATESSVIAAFTAANVPIISFAYGSGAPGGTLQSMSSATGGRFYQSPTTLAQIQQAFLDANAAIADVAVPSSGLSTVAPGASSSIPFQVDSTVGSFSLNIAYPSSAANMTLSLLGPSGTAVGGSFTCTEASGSTSCILTIDAATLAAAGAGTYTIVANNVSGTAIPVTHFVTADPVPGFTYSARLASVTGQEVAYPAPMILGVTVAKDWPIAGLTVSGEVTSPSGVVTPVTFHDDGIDGDEEAGDGVYSAIFIYTESGVHSVRADVNNSAGTGAFTEAGFLKTVMPDGTPPGAQSLGTVAENFTRSTTLQVNATGVVSDDHANNPAGFGCTAITANNSDTAGRIDTGGDVDCFAVIGIPTSGDLNVRVTNLSPGVKPSVTIYRADGSTVVATGNFDSNFVTGGGVVITVASSDIDPLGLIITVQDQSATTTGTYKISAGPAISSDTAPVGLADDNSGGGGAFDPRSLGLLIVLALAGWFIRRRCYVG